MQTQKIDEVSDTTYYEYTSDILDKNWDNTKPYDYTVSKDYAIVFTALNKHFFDVALTDVWNKIKEDMTQEPNVDEPNFVNTLNFISNDKVAIECDTWA